MVIIMLVTAFTGSKLNTILIITYKDLKLFFIFYLEIRKPIIRVSLTLAKTKSYKKQKRL